MNGKGSNAKTRTYDPTGLQTAPGHSSTRREPRGPYGKLTHRTKREDQLERRLQYRTSQRKKGLTIEIRSLVDDSEDSDARQFVRAEVSEMRSEPESEQTESSRQDRRVDQPGNEESSVGRGGERDGIEHDGGSDAFLESQTR
jgi:hypothetical protein